MNKKITVLTPIGNIRYCVFDSNEDYARQAEKLLGITSGDCLGVVWEDDRFCLVDLPHWDVVAPFKIISIEDCDMDVSLEWTVVQSPD